MARSTARALRQYSDWVKWTSVGVIVVSLLVLVQALPIEKLIRAGMDWIDGLGLWGPVVYGLFYVVATVLFVPGSIPTMAAGALFGLGVGVVTASISSTVGAMLAFLIARYVARDKVAKLAQRNPKFDAIDRAVGEGGWKVVALLRLSPVVPFNLQNYLYGLTQVRFWPCFLATWVAMLPGTFLYVYIGHVAGVAVAGERERSAWEWMMLVVGLLATAVVTVYITLLAKKKLSEQTQVEDEESQVKEKKEKASASKERRADPQAGKPLWTALVTVVLAVVAVVAAAYAQLNPGAIEDLLGGLFMCLV